MAGELPDAALAVMARLPVPGACKTRLAAGVGAQQACNFYRACAEHVIQQGDSCTSLRASVFHSTNDTTVDVEAWVHTVAPGLPVLPQSSGDLGEKLLHALEQQLTWPGVTKALVVGSDIPGLDARVMEAAVRALDAHEAVMGPAEDGGYYLLGVRGRAEPRLFQGITWSTDTVLRDTLERAREAGLRMAPLEALPRLRDVDTREDLEAWVADATAAGAGAQTTQPVLQVARQVLGASSGAS